MALLTCFNRSFCGLLKKGVKIIYPWVLKLIPIEKKASCPSVFIQKRLGHVVFAEFSGYLSVRIWVNYNISLTWIVGPWLGMIPRILFPWFQASGEQASVVMKFTQIKWWLGINMVKHGHLSVGLSDNYPDRILWFPLFDAPHDQSIHLGIIQAISRMASP